MFSRIWSYLTVLLMISALTFAGCGDEATNDGDDDNDDDATDSSTEEDTGSETTDESCSNFPSAFDEQASSYYPQQQAVRFNAFEGLTEGTHDAAEGIFVVTLFSDYGAVLEPGTISLTGIETSYETCGYCVEYHEGATLTNGELASAAHSFMPSDGTLEITALTPQAGGDFNFKVSATMVEVTIDPETYETQTVADGCVFTVTDFVATTTML